MREEKLKRFIHDEVMAKAVYDILLAAFLKERPGQDVHILAASILAIQHLNQAWKELEHYKHIEKKLSTPSNVGL